MSQIPLSRGVARFSKSGEPKAFLCVSVEADLSTTYKQVLSEKYGDVNRDSPR